MPISAIIRSSQVTVRETDNGQVQLKVAQIDGATGTIAALADNDEAHADADRGWLSEAELSGYISEIGGRVARRLRDELDALRALFRAGERVIAAKKQIAANRTPERVAAHRHAASENLAALIAILEGDGVIDGIEDPMGDQVRDCLHVCRRLFEQVGDDPLTAQAYRAAEDVYRHLTDKDRKLSFVHAREILSQLQRSVDHMLEPCTCVALLTGGVTG